MKIIVLKDVPSLGKKDDIKDVREGFVRNFLLPRGFAKIATPAAVADLAREEKRRVDARAAAANAEKIAADRLSSVTLNIAMKAGENEKTFGAVSATKIQQELRKQKIAIEKEWILLEKPIKTTGEHAVAVQFPSGAKSTMKIMVEAEE